MTFTISDGSSTVTLCTPDSLTESVSTNLSNIVFNNGNDVQMTYGKANDTLILGGVEYDDAFSIMQSLNTFMENRAPVTVAGLPDSYLNTDYYLTGVNFELQAGYIDIYNYNITLERRFDRL